MSALSDAYAHCAELVRAQDKDRFLAALFAPQDKRPHLLALAAFNIEVARVREVVREPLPGEIRLTWWREVLEGEGRGDVQGHPVAQALLATLSACALPAAPLIALVEARTFDLYDDPMPTLSDLEGYAGETASALIQLAALVLDPAAAARRAEAAGHGGVAFALCGLMRAFAVQAARGQCYVPLDVLGRHGGGRAEAVSGTPSPALMASLAELRAVAGRHLASAAAALEGLEPALAPAFLPLTRVPGDLEALARVRDPFREAAGLSPLGRQFALWRGARRVRAGKGLLPAASGPARPVRRPPG